MPGKAMARKEGLEKILKRLQSINKQLQYQIWLGHKNLEVMVKNHKKFDYKPYRKIEISSIDPNNEVPEWDLITKDFNQPDQINPFDIRKSAGKRGAVESPEGYRSKRSNIDDWQVQEFVWAFLEGTTTAPNYSNLTWELEKNNESEAAQEEESSIETGRSSEEAKESEADIPAAEEEDIK